MCEFCENAPFRYGDTRESERDMFSSGSARLFYIAEFGKRFFLTTSVRNDRLKINYCPICGRKLVENVKS